MPEWIKTIILGIVEGITEFLPISSTGHLIVASAVLNFQNSMGGTFEIFIQAGAMVAVVAYYRVELFTIVKNMWRDRPTQQFVMVLLVAFLPAAALGALLSDWIKTVFFSPTVVGSSLIYGGLVFLLIEYRPPHNGTPQNDTDNVTTVTMRQAVIIGLAQMLALIPGTSRSGASIIGGMLAGLNRKVATQFSFYLAIPTLGGATVYDLYRNRDLITADNLFLLGLGAVVAGVVAWLSIGWLLRYVSRNNFIAFGYYRIAAGIIILLLVWSGLI